MLRRFLELLLREVLRIAVGVTLESLDLHALLHRVLQLSGFRLQLLVFDHLFFDFLAQFLNHLSNRLDSGFCVVLETLHLRVEAFLVFLFLFHVLTLNDFLRLLGHSVKLHVFSAFFQVCYLQQETFVLVDNRLKGDLAFQDVRHVLDFCVAPNLDLVVLEQNVLLQNQNCVFEVSGNWRLRDFNLPLLQVNYHLKVVL